MTASVPSVVATADERAALAGFELSCGRHVGRYLAVLAAAVPPGGRALELGSGLGVGLAWLVHGLGVRHDVEVVSVEMDSTLHARLIEEPRPDFVRCLHGDAVELLPTLGSFDLIFADAQGGKWDRLDLTIDALSPGGVLVVDDMTPDEWMSAEHEVNTAMVARTLLGHPQLVAAEMAFGSGVITATKRS